MTTVRYYSSFPKLKCDALSKVQVLTEHEFSLKNNTYYVFKRSLSFFFSPEFKELEHPDLIIYSTKSTEKVTFICYKDKKLKIVFTKDGYETTGIKGKKLGDVFWYRLSTIESCKRAEWCFRNTLTEEFEFKMHSSKPFGQIIQNRVEQKVFETLIPDLNCFVDSKKRKLLDDESEQKMKEFFNWIGILNFNIQPQQSVSNFEVPIGDDEVYSSEVNGFIPKSYLDELMLELKDEKFAVIIAKTCPCISSEPNSNFVFLKANNWIFCHFYDSKANKPRLFT